MVASGDSRESSRDPTVLFDEYVQGVLDGHPPDVATLYRRAGERSDDLQAMIRVARLLQDIREGAVDAALPPDAAPHAAVELERLGRFLQLRPLGEGGLSRVYRARDPQLHREVALKVLSVPAGARREWVLNEGRSLAHLSHPGVVRVNSLEEDEGRPFLVMDLVPGPSLREVLVGLREQAGRLAPDEVPPAEPARAAATRLAGVAARCELVARMAEALDYCHKSGVIHRDIKPHNVLLAEDDQPMLIDFGLAHLQSEVEAGTDITQRLVGTPAYIAPEQVDSNRTGASALSDQFSLGVLLYELLTLRHPFRLATRTDTLTAISRAAPPLPRRLEPGLPQDLERIVLHALERAPHARYPDCAALAGDLRAFLQHRAISLQAPTSLQATRLFLRRNRRHVRLVAAGLLVVAALWITVGVLQTRAAAAGVRAELQQLVGASLPAARGPAAFQDVYLQLASLRQRAHVLDASPLAAVAGSRLEADVDRSVRLASEGLAQAVAVQAGDAEVSDAMARSAMRSTLLLWAPVIALDRQLCPDSPHTRGLRERGQVELPAAAHAGDVRVLRVASDRQRIVQPVLEEVPAARVLSAAELGTGVYRVLFRDRDTGTSFEVDLPLRAEDPRWTLQPGPRTAALDELVDCPGGTIELPSLAPAVMADARVEVAPFRISRRPVSWRDVIEVWPERGQALFSSPVNKLMSGHMLGEADLDEPALVPWDTALEFARDVGARLPTALETRLAWASPELQLPPAGHQVKAEWTGDVTSVFDEMRVTSPYDKRDETDWARWTGAHPDFAFSANTAFRLALTADPWAQR